MQRTRVTRRSVLVAAAGVLGGCVGSGPPVAEGTATPTDGHDTATPTDEPTDDLTNEPTATSFRRVDTCPSPDSAAVETSGQTVIVRGCLRGANGCSVAVLDTVAYYPADDRLRVVVGTETRRGADEACTQAIVDRGYELEVTFRERPPAEVVVVHDGVDGAHDVTTAET